MEDRKGSGPAPRPETANPHKADSEGNHEPENIKPVLSLVSESHGTSSHVEDGFFAKGAADDKAALEMYAAMLPRGYSLRRINPRYLMLAGGVALLLIGIAAGRHLPGGHSSETVAEPAESTPAVVAPAPAPAPAAPVAAAPSPEPPTAPAPVAAAEPTMATPPPPAPAEPAAKQEPTAAAPAVAAAPAEQPAPQPEKPVAAAVAAAPAEQPAPQAEKPVAPAVAAVPAEQPAPQAEKPVAPAVAAAPAEQPAPQAEKTAAPAAAAPAPEPKALAAAKPAEIAPAKPAPEAAPAEAQNVQACRNAIKKRDLKAVSANCETALAADSSLAKPLLSFAKAQFESGKSAQAAVWARKIVQVNNSLPDAYLIMGAAEQEARHTAAAKAAYQRYLELAPKGPYADDVRSSLKAL